MSDREIVELELHTPDAHQRFRVERDGTVVVTTSGPVGGKERTSRKDHRTVGKARQALARAVLKKESEGYFPADGSWPLPVGSDTDAPGITLVAVPPDRSGSAFVRDTLPRAMEALRERYFDACDGPDGATLWFPGTLHVGRRHFVREVQPPLAGAPSDFPLREIGHPARPDGEAVVVAHGGTLYEVAVESAQATEWHRLVHPERFAAVHTILYGDRDTLLWADGPTLVAVPRGGSPRPALELHGEDILGAARLADGRIAVLQPSRLTIVRLGPPVEGTHEMPVAHGVALGTWLGGRVLVVTTWDPRRAIVAFALHDDGLHEMYAGPQRADRAFDRHGAQWIEVDDPARAFRVCGVEAAWRAAAATPVVARDHVVTAVPVHDVIAAVASGEATLDQLRAAVARVPGGLEERAYRDGWTPLGYAAWRGLGDVVDLLLELGADVDGISGRTGRSPLGSAVEEGHLDVAERLLARGARGALPAEVEVDGRTVAPESPVVAAARKGQHDLVLRLLDGGAPIDATGHDGATALTAAAGAGHVALAKELLARGASVEAVRDGAPSPLIAALDSRDLELLATVASRSREIRGPVGARALRSACLSLSVRSVPREAVDVLVEHGARTTAPDALQYAIESNHAGAVAAVLDAGADPNAPYRTATKPSLPLQVAFFHADPDPEVVEALLAGGAAVDALDDRGLPALNYAVANCRDPALIARLLDAGASVGPVGNAWGALHQAAYSGRVDVIDLLVDRGAAIDALTADGRAPIAMAADQGQRDALRHLLGRGADPNAGSWTALMAAAVRDDVETMDVLLDAGANPARKGANPARKGDATARTAQEHAELAGARSAAARLAERGGRGYATLHGAVEADDLDAVRAMLDAGADPDEVRGDTGVPAIHRAKSLAVLALLLDRGAAPDATDREGRTALFACAAAGDDEAVARVELLLSRGADPKRVTSAGLVALHAAAWSGNAAVARRLLDAGCPAESPWMLDQPLHVAARRDDVAMARLLLDAGAQVAPLATTYHGVEETPLHVAADHGAVGVAELLLARGADPGAGADDGDDVDPEDDTYWAAGGYTPIHRAAEAGKFDVLATLLRGDRYGARFEATAGGKTAEELAEDHPRCQALLRAMAAPGTSVDDALAQLAAAENAAVQAEAEGRLWVERVTEPIPDGTGLAPDAVRRVLQRHDWVRTVPGAAHSLVLRFFRGLHQVAVGDAEGVHTLPLTIRGQRLPYAIDPDGARFLVSDGRAVYVADGPGRTAWEAVPADALPGPVTEVGWLADGACFVVAGGRILAFPRRDPGGPAPDPWWSVPAEGVHETHGTGTALVGVVLAARLLRVLWVRFDPDGLRPHAWLDDRLVLVTPRREGDRVDAVAYSGWYDPRVYRLHHLEGAQVDGPRRERLPDERVFGEIPRLVVTFAQ